MNFRKKLVFYCPEMKSVADQIRKSVTAENIWFGEVQWNLFETGLPNLHIENAEEIHDAEVVFLASFDATNIFQQLAVIYAIPRYGARSLKVILPYFPTGTMERVVTYGDIATAMTLARQLSAIPLSKMGPAEIIMFDIHALQEQFYFSDMVLPRLETAISLLKKRIGALPDRDNIVIAFPDLGAHKRFGDQFETFPQILCHKIRCGENKKKVIVVEGDPKGRHAIIVDDIDKTCGTKLACKDVLFASGAAAVSSYSTHGEYPKESWKNMIDAGFQHVWITDSCPRSANIVRGMVGFEVFSLAGEIERIIRT